MCGAHFGMKIRHKHQTKITTTSIKNIFHQKRTTPKPFHSILTSKFKTNPRIMKTFTLRSQFIFPTHSNLTNPPKSHPIFIPTRPKSIKNTLPLPPTSKFIHLPPKTKYLTKTPILDSKLTPISKKPSRNEITPDGYSRYVVLGAASVGLLMFLMGTDDGQKALALGPGGPLMEDFWDNMRRYGLYVLTVSTGALSAIFYPIFELLKNPITAILILVIVGGGFYIVTQVVSAMIGVTDFSYQYTY